MSESLRMRVVEAGAKAIDDEIGSEMREHLAHILRKWPNTIESLAEVALDAMLDCLAENADEWWDAWFDSSRDLYDSLNDDHIRQLLPVLREDR